MSTRLKTIGAAKNRAVAKVGIRDRGYSGLQPKLQARNVMLSQKMTALVLGG